MHKKSNGKIFIEKQITFPTILENKILRKEIFSFVTPAPRRPDNPPIRPFADFVKYFHNFVNCNNHYYNNLRATFGILSNGLTGFGFLSNAIPAQSAHFQSILFYDKKVLYCAHFFVKKIHPRRILISYFGEYLYTFGKYTFHKFMTFWELFLLYFSKIWLLFQPSPFGLLGRILWLLVSWPFVIVFELVLLLSLLYNILFL